jgi:Flp pilus assembly secretin CpaC
MTPISVTQTNTGRSAVIAVDNFLNPFNIGVGAAEVSGTATADVQYSFDDPMDAGYVAGNATWYSAPNLTSLSSSTSAAFTVPCKALSLNVTGTGVWTLTIVQAGTR